MKDFLSGHHDPSKKDHGPFPEGMPVHTGPLDPDSLDEGGEYLDDAIRAEDAPTNE